MNVIMLSVVLLKGVMMSVVVPTACLTRKFETWTVFNVASTSNARGLYHKTFYGRNLWFPYKARVFVPGKPFQTSLVFKVKHASLLRKL
jgi:hypothetical protein